MTKEAILDHGRFCMSGFAYRFDQDRALCINIARTSRKSDLSDFSIQGPVKCDLSLGMSACFYQGQGRTGSQFNLTCDCSLKDKDAAFCPLPD